MRTLRQTRLLAALLVCAAPATAWAADGIGPFVNGVPTANPAEGSPANVISPDFSVTKVVTGSDPLENPSGVITNFGFLSDGTRTEPDQNLYIESDQKAKGPTAKYNYGHHFLYQGHENSANLAYVTRVNLDVSDPAHRVTLLTPVGGDGLTHFNSIDGSAYDPFTKSLLFTQEASGTTGGIVEIGTDFPATVTTRYGLMGRCGQEGIHTDNKGRIYLVEDTGGKAVSVDSNDINGPKFAKQPNSYIYRFVPYNRNHLDAGGKLQALQVSVDGAPLVFGGDDDQSAFNDTWSPKQVELHSGASFPTTWVTVHNTATDGTAEFNCNLAARAAGATPFKRPENGAFNPDGSFRNITFVTTGDTDNRSGSVAGLAQRGAWGSIWRLSLDKKQENGTIKNIVLGDATHNSYDNVTFGDSNTIVTNDQLDTLDSIWAYPVNNVANPLRLVALGRDPGASGDGEEDNEPTGMFVSNGERIKPDQYGNPTNLLGARGFFTDQHGENNLFELHHN
ncbi:MAG TPA: alkaline phosphatase PhoX [Rhizomicrobium sp.]|nr:alkaline phosphatase PhoX [Rhizomicrobium sp.]